MFERAAAHPGLALHILYCGRPYIDPTLQVGLGTAHCELLSGTYWRTERRFLHLAPSVPRVLGRIDPTVVVTTGFVPTYLMAYAWARRHRRAHVAMSDSTWLQERVLGPVHRWLRRRVFAHTETFVGASQGTLDIYRQHGVDERRLFLAPLCVDNGRFGRPPGQEPRFDFIFSGRFIGSKRPGFAIEVAAGCAALLGRRTRLLMLGAGELEPVLREQASSHTARLEVDFRGYLPQKQLPAAYAEARVLLFPTDWEAWGLVANEAAATGLPIFATPEAGCAGELVRDGVNGRVLPAERQLWVREAASLLQDEQRMALWSAQSRQLASIWTFESATEGFVQAVRLAAAQHSQRQVAEGR